MSYTYPAILLETAYATFYVGDVSGFFMAAGPDEVGWIATSTLRDIAAHLRMRGEDQHERRSERCFALGVRHPWEDSLASGSVIYRDPAITVVADATLYYRRDLARALSLQSSGADRASAACLIAAAYRRHGAACVDMLEGDFAFALWDTQRMTAFAARDPFGARSLYYWTSARKIVVCSLQAPLRQIAGDPELDVRNVVRAITNFHGDGQGTPWKGIVELPAGWSMTWEEGRGAAPRRYWYPVHRAEWSGGDVVEAGSILADLIGDATVERMGPGRTAIGMSGGRDSTAVVGTLERRRSVAGNSLPPLSVLSFRYPNGDPGNEDVYVREIEMALGLDVRWLDTASMPLFADAAAEGGRRTRPEPQPFEGQNRALAASAQDEGARILLNGNGGDNLFGLADTWLADLFRTGQWYRLARHLGEKGYETPRDIFQICMKPALPLRILDHAERWLGRRILSRPWETRALPWLRDGLVEWEEVFAEDRASYRLEIERVGRSVTERCRLWAFLYPGFTRNSASLFDMSLDEGVELRMPFYDRRVADFAWSRPPTDLNRGREHKVILRHAMQGILPDAVIAPRVRRTGTTEGYYRQAAEREFLAYATRATENSRLADLGVVDPDSFSAAVERWSLGNRQHEVALFITICVEFWLRAHDSQPSSDHRPAR